MMKITESALNKATQRVIDALDNERAKMEDSIIAAAKTGITILKGRAVIGDENVSGWLREIGEASGFGYTTIWKRENCVVNLGLSADSTDAAIRRAAKAWTDQSLGTAKLWLKPAKPAGTRKARSRKVDPVDAAQTRVRSLTEQLFFCFDDEDLDVFASLPSAENAEDGQISAERMKEILVDALQRVEAVLENK